MRDSISITPMRVADAVRCGGIDPGWDAAAIETICKRKAFRGMVAEYGDESELRGFIIGDCMGDEAEIIHLAVAPMMRRQGIAKRLLAAFIAGQKRCFLEVREDNAPAIALYVSAGFTISGRRKGYYGGGVDGLCMARGEIP